jgi:hypothetical protein
MLKWNSTTSQSFVSAHDGRAESVVGATTELGNGEHEPPVSDAEDGDGRLRGQRPSSVTGSRSTDAALSGVPFCSCPIAAFTEAISTHVP